MQPPRGAFLYCVLGISQPRQSSQLLLCQSTELSDTDLLGLPTLMKASFLWYGRIELSRIEQAGSIETLLQRSSYAETIDKSRRARSQELGDRGRSRRRQMRVCLYAMAGGEERKEAPVIEERSSRSSDIEIGKPRQEESDETDGCADEASFSVASPMNGLVRLFDRRPLSRSTSIEEESSPEEEFDTGSGKGEA